MEVTVIGRIYQKEVEPSAGKWCWNLMTPSSAGGMEDDLLSAQQGLKQQYFNEQQRFSR
jgi:hypothetical protein